jgi:hypothetical protein
MNRNSISGLVLIAALAVIAIPASAQSRCPAGTSGCESLDDLRSKINEEARDFFQQKSTWKAQDYDKRAKSLRERTGECGTCAKDVLEHGWSMYKGQR